MNKRIAFVKEWRVQLADVLEEGPARHLALELFAKFMLRRLQKATKSDVVGRRSKANLRKLQ